MNPHPDIGKFQSGFLVTNTERRICYTNTYVQKMLGLKAANIEKQLISALLTKASNIFLDSYVFPIIWSQGQVEECQLFFKGEHGEPVPVVANLNAEGDLLYWSVFCCENRDKLLQKHIETERLLEERTVKLHELATTDPLTGVLNRREFLARAERLIAQLSRAKSSYVLLVIDIDKFKSINDEHGHAAGDEVIIRVSKQLQEGRRQNDILARLGGDEFILLLADADEKAGKEIAETLRERVELTSEGCFRVTISLGVVASRLNTQSELLELYGLADDALYRSKKSGRNKTSFLNQER